MKKIAMLTGAICIASSSMSLQAGEHDPELYVGLSLTDFDANVGVNEATAIDLGLSFPVKGNFFMEAWAAIGSASASDFDLNRYTLNGLYQIDATENFKPFVTLGFSNTELDDGVLDASKDSVDVGIGFKRYFEDDNWIFRGDLILATSLEGDEGDDLIKRITIGYNFGERGSYTPPPPPVIKAPEAPKPVVAAAPVDSDGDGVFDADDNCSDTAAKLKVDANGCPIILTEKVTIDLEVKFANNSDVVSDAYMTEIKKVADFLEQYEGTSVEIKGYTDDRGAAEYNRKLSDRRAKSVAAVLVEDFGVDSSRVSANGYGEVNPIGDNNTPAGRAANRRVVAEVSATKKTAVEK